MIRPRLRPIIRFAVSVTGILGLLLTQTGLVNALSAEQTQLYVQGIDYYDATVPASCGSTITTVSSTLPAAVPEPHRSLFTQAANAYKTSPQLLAAIFLTENGNAWRPFNYPWQSSPQAGASGPFQFMPATWDAYKVDGNNDGIKDINNMYDAAYSAANMLSQSPYSIKANSPLGNIATPFQPGTFLYASAAYNWGPGILQMQTTSSSPITVAPLETQNYLKNVYALITSGFTKSGNPNYGNPVVPAGAGGSGSGLSPGTGCSGGVVSGSIVKTAIGLAWPSAGHGPHQADATPAYQKAMPLYNGSTGDMPYSDCGVFVSTVMRASGADTNYPKRFTPAQETYLENSPKYVEVHATNTTQLQAGDIFVSSNHTYIFVGRQPGGNTVAEASHYGNVPEINAKVQFTDYLGEPFRIFRLK